MPGVGDGTSGSLNNLIIANPATWSDAAAIIGTSTELTGGPATNLQTMQATDVWATNPASGDPYVVLDRGSAQPFTFVGVFWTNITNPTATITLKAGNTLGSIDSETAYSFQAWPNSDAFTGWDRTHAWSYLPLEFTTSPSPARYVKLTFSEVDLPLYVGRLYIANAWQPSRPHWFDYKTAWVDRSKRQELGAVTLVREVAALRKIDWFLTDIPQDEMMTWADEIDHQRRGARDIFVCLDPGNFSWRHRLSVCGLMEQNEPINRPEFLIHEKTYSVTELG